VEFVKYRPFDPRAVGRFNRFGQPRYGAFVLRAGTQAWVELGAAEDIEASVLDWGSALRSPLDLAVRKKGQAVYRRVMVPLDRLLGGSSQLFVVPDDVLNLLPFSALPGADGRYLVESRAVTYLASSRDVLRFAKGPVAREPALIIAAPDVSFAPLTGAAREGQSIAQYLPGARLVKGPDATESLVKGVHGPVVLHLATHAFFAGATRQSGDDVTASMRGLKRVSIDRAPLLRAAIALAAGHPGTGAGEDGLLTALEMSSLDLRGTKLVVLSACETGIGEVRAGDGVHGFRRALTLAGAESQVLTLWRVDDQATADLMTHYYRALRAGAGRQAALRSAQLAILRDSGRSHPFYWGAFVGAGAISPIIFDRH
jgi:CHAT domain-containing protein